MSTSLELACLEELDRCYDIINMGRIFQQEQGFVQWTEEYPNRKTIQGDIACGKGYVLKVDEEIAGYMCIDFDGEPAYDNIEGSWRTSEPYAVVHRMAFDSKFRGAGLTDIAFQRIEELCIRQKVYSIRVDTDFPNKRMQHILQKNGYEHCGVIVFQGGGKLAYDKSLAP